MKRATIEPLEPDPTSWTVERGSDWAWGENRFGKRIWRRGEYRIYTCLGGWVVRFKDKEHFVETMEQAIRLQAVHPGLLHEAGPPLREPVERDPKPITVFFVHGVGVEWFASGAARYAPPDPKSRTIGSRQGRFEYQPTGGHWEIRGPGGFLEEMPNEPRSLFKARCRAAELNKAFAKKR